LLRRAGTVALLGRPNAGKSTLVNALLGETVAIVSQRPQTTRHRIAGVWTVEEGQAVLFDLPGVHRPLHRMNVQMMHVVRETLAEVDLILQLFDASALTGGGEEFVSRMVSSLATPVILVPTKLDLVGDAQTLARRVEFFTARQSYADVVPVAALHGRGLDTLRKAIFSRLPEGEPWLDPSLTTTQSERFFVAELIREAALARVGEELPYALAVHLRHFQEEEGGSGSLLRIFADLVVEREGQKAILIGAGGSMIKAIGTAARRRIETLLGARVWLDLRVKVRPGWRDQAGFLSQLEPFEVSWSPAEGEE